MNRQVERVEQAFQAYGEAGQNQASAAAVRMRHSEVEPALELPMTRDFGDSSRLLGEARAANELATHYFPKSRDATSALEVQAV